MDRSEVKWKVRDKEIPRGPMALTPRQAKIIATKSDLGYSEKDILNNNFENIEGAVWLLTKYYKPLYNNNTDNPFGFALINFFLGEKPMDRILKNVNGQNVGKKINFELVLQKIPNEIKEMVNKFLPEKKERS